MKMQKIKILLKEIIQMMVFKIKKSKMKKKLSHIIR